MCRPDLDTLTTFQWREGEVKPMLSPERPIRRCVNWDILMGSLENDIIHEDEISALENPLRFGDIR